MKVYLVSLSNGSGLEVSYGMFSTENKAVKYAKNKMAEIESVFTTESKLVNFDNLNIIITGYTLDKEDEFNVASWILRENGKFTPETEEDRFNWLEENANKLGYTLVEE